ncbi:MAG: hypothetical protein AUH82_02315 [Chloroflexi bacterium 13_1_40CM_4_65_13]|nr:MAG: hypothetical protein AUH82_02315 [Chloroflexi bacterium 13_1_40CM_4_65_13]
MAPRASHRGLLAPTNCSRRAAPDRGPGALPRGLSRVRGEIGRGGQSIVHRAVDEFVGREVALKELLPALAGEGGSGLRA